MSEPRNLAEWLRQRMTEGRKVPMTYRQVAEYADIATTTVKRILDGERISADVLLKLAEWSGEPFETLRELANQQEKPMSPEDEEAWNHTILAIQRDNHIRPAVKEHLEAIIEREHEAWHREHNH